MRGGYFSRPLLPQMKREWASSPNLTVSPCVSKVVGTIETIGHEERATPRATSRCHVYDAFTVASVVNTDCPTTIAERNTSNCRFKS